MKNNEFVGADENFVPEERKQAVEEPNTKTKKIAIGALLLFILIPICVIIFIAIMMFRMASVNMDKAKDIQSDFANQSQYIQQQYEFINKVKQIQANSTR